MDALRLPPLRTQKESEQTNDKGMDRATIGHGQRQLRIAPDREKRLSIVRTDPF
jgi:hypothetical protein